MILLLSLLLSSHFLGPPSRIFPLPFPQQLSTRQAETSLKAIRYASPHTALDKSEPMYEVPDPAEEYEDEMYYVTPNDSAGHTGGRATRFNNVANGHSLSPTQEELYATANDMSPVEIQRYMPLTPDTLDKSGVYTTPSPSPYRSSPMAEAEGAAAVGDDGYLTVIQDSPSLEYEEVTMEISMA